MPALRTRAAVLTACGALALTGLVALPGAASAATREPAAAHHYLPGDFDGDGHRDLVVGAPGADRVRISYTKLKIKGSHTVTIAPPAKPKEAMNFGTSFALGDFNGDGYSDLAVAAPQYTTSTKVGAVFVYLGSGSGLHATPLTIVGPGPEDVDSDFYNVDTLAAADVDGDGRTDLAVGTYTSVRIFHGYAHGVTTKGATRINEGGGDFTGADSLALGDFNGDHHLDLVVGRAGMYGELDIFNGTAHGFSSTKQVIAGDDVGAAEEPYEDFGTTLTAGDFNGDGHRDLAAGVPGGSLVVVLFGGKQGLQAKNRQEFTAQSAGVADGDLIAFGTAVAAGQITNDAYTDLVIGAPDVRVSGKKQAGEVFVVHGSADGLVDGPAQHVTLASPGVPGAPVADAHFGAALYVADFAGSANPDVVIAAPTDSQSKYQAGYVVRLLGTKNGVTTSKSASSASSSEGALFGTGLG